MIAVVIGLNLPLLAAAPKARPNRLHRGTALHGLEQTKQVLSGLSEDVSLYLIVERAKRTTTW
jgi:hypothetical protein